LARFLLARLHLDLLQEKLNVAGVRKSLQILPNGLDDSYNETMERICRQDEDRKQLAMQVFMWITYAVRPLRIGELQHALAVEPQTACLDPETIYDVEILLSVCAGLVVIDDEQHVVRLVRT
jgi:hypothetical protein